METPKKNSLPTVCRCYTREPYDVQNHLDVMGFARSISEHYVADLRENLVRKSKLRASDVVNLLN